MKIEALPEGTAIHAHVPVYQIIAEGEMSRLVTYLETLLTMVWVSSFCSNCNSLKDDSFTCCLKSISRLFFTFPGDSVRTNTPMSVHPPHPYFNIFALSFPKPSSFPFPHVNSTQ